MHLTPITGDVFDITQRIKEINEGYRLMYNHKYHRYEVYCYVGFTPTLALTWTDRLDMRLIVKLYETRISNIKKIVAEIERANEEKQNRIIDKALDTAGYELREYLNYANRRNY